VSRARNSLKISCEGVEDLFGGLLPHEGLGVVVPACDPGPDVGFEGLDGLVGSAADHLVGQETRTSVRLARIAGWTNTAQATNHYLHHPADALQLLGLSM
jgi:hypothetical protein